MEWVLNQTQTILLALGVFFTGTLLHGRVFLLRKFNIPEPVIGGLFIACFFAFLFYRYGVTVQIDTHIRDDLMLVFFATVGLNARLTLFKKGGPKLLLFLGVAIVCVFLQNAVGVGLAKLFGIHPLLGLIAGSITMTGGHGTGASYATKFAHIDGAMEIAMACATCGLVMGGLIGGPLAEWLIAKYQLAPEDKVKNPDEALEAHGFHEPELVTTSSLLQILGLTMLAVVSGRYLYSHIGEQAKVPEFIFVMFIAIAITNLNLWWKKVDIQTQSLNLVNMMSLSLFLSIAMMSLRLWHLVDLALPLLVIMMAQVLTICLFSYYVTFRVLGRDYDAVTIVCGHCGFGLGATPTALANVESLTNRYGPAPSALFIVLIVGAFFIDIINAVVIQCYLSFMG